MRTIVALALVAGIFVGERPLPRSAFGVVAFDLTPPVSQKMAELGVGLVRGSCGWGDLEPARGVFRWDCADRVIVPASRQGLRSYMTVNCTPDWANGGAGCRRLPDDLTAWYDFVANFVVRYGNMKTILGVWNEPNLTLDGGAAAYVELFVNASRARTAVNAWFAIAGPETSHHALNDGYFEAAVDGIASWRALAPQDVVAVHWYPDGPTLADYLDQIHRIAGNDVWLSETGIGVPDATAQARFYDELITGFASSERPAWWTHVIFYRLWDGQPCCTDAILNADFSNKPAFDVFSRWMADLDRRVRPARRDLSQ